MLIIETRLSMLLLLDVKQVDGICSMMKSCHAARQSLRKNASEAGTLSTDEVVSLSVRHCGER